jgi:hypothetical protein
MNPHKKVDRLKQLSKVFLYFTTTSQSQLFYFQPNKIRNTCTAATVDIIWKK